MAYYCQVTGVTRPEIRRIRFNFELKDDTTTPHRVVLQDSVSIEMVRIDATDTDGTVLTPAQRRQALRDFIIGYFQQYLAYVRGADADYNAVSAASVGFRYPPA